MKNIKIIFVIIIYIYALSHISNFIINTIHMNIVQNLTGITAINENYHLDLPQNKDYSLVYHEGIIDIFLFEKLIYNEEDTKEIVNKLNNHDKNILAEKLDIIYKGLNEQEIKKYKENFNYDYKKQDEVYFYSNTKRDRETLLIYNPEEKAIYHLSNAIFE